MPVRRLTINLRDFRDHDLEDQEIVVQLAAGDRAEAEGSEPGRLVSAEPISVWTDTDGVAWIDVLPAVDLDGRQPYLVSVPGVGNFRFQMPDTATSLYSVLTSGSPTLPARQLPDPNNVDDGSVPVALDNLWTTGRVVYIQTSTPTTPSTGATPLWIDTSTTPPDWKFWNGTAWQTFSLGADEVTSLHLATGSVDADALAAGAVTEPKLATGGVSTRALADDAVTMEKIGNNAVGTEQIDGGAVVTGSIADDQITREKMAEDAVDSDALAPNSVYSGALQNNAVTTAKLADGAVTRPKIATGVINQGHISTGSVGSDEIIDGAVTEPKLAGGAVSTRALANLSVNNFKVAQDAIYTNSIQDGAVQATKLSADAVETAKVLDGAITRAKLANDVPVLPAGGTTDQVLTKQSNTDFDTAWEDPAGGVSIHGSNVGGRLVKTDAAPNQTRLVEALLLSADIDPTPANIQNIQNLLHIAEEDGHQFYVRTITIGHDATSEDYGFNTESGDAFGSIDNGAIDWYGQTASLVGVQYDSGEDTATITLSPHTITGTPPRDFGFYFPGTGQTILLKDAQGQGDTNYTPEATTYEFAGITTAPYPDTDGLLVVVVIGTSAERAAYRTIASRVAAWALAGNTDTLPASKIPVLPQANLANNSVGTAQLQTDSVITGIIEDGAVTGSKVGSGQITSSKLATGAVTNNKLGSDVLRVPARGTATIGDVLTRTSNDDTGYAWRAPVSGGAGGASDATSHVQYVSLWTQSTSSLTVLRNTGITGAVWGQNGWSSIPSGWYNLPYDGGSGNRYHAWNIATFDPDTDSWSLGTWTIELADSFSEQYSPNPYANPATITTDVEATSKYWRRRNIDGTWPSIWHPLYTGLASWTLLKSQSINVSSRTEAVTATFEVPLPLTQVRMVGFQIDLRGPANQTDVSHFVMLGTWNQFWPKASGSTSTTFLAGASFSALATEGGLTVVSSQRNTPQLSAGSTSSFGCKFQLRGSTSSGSVVDAYIYEWGAINQNGYFNFLYL